MGKDNADSSIIQVKTEETDADQINKVFELVNSGEWLARTNAEKSPKVQGRSELQVGKKTQNQRRFEVWRARKKDWKKEKQLLCLARSTNQLEKKCAQLTQG